ncbi:hypothetical protein Efla_004556 [Eimeria flavescens]
MAPVPGLPRSRLSWRCQCPPAVRRSLGKSQYHRKFTPNSSTVTEPLLQATTVKHGFKWSAACDLIWRSLREALSSEPVLAHPDYAREFHVDSDGSGCGLGAVLLPLIGRRPRRRLRVARLAGTREEVDGYRAGSRRPYLGARDLQSRGPRCHLFPHGAGLAAVRAPGRGLTPMAAHSDTSDEQEVDAFLSDDDEPPGPAPGRAEHVQRASPSLDPTPPTAVATVKSGQIALPPAVQHDDIWAAQQSKPLCQKLFPLATIPRAQWPAPWRTAPLAFSIHEQRTPRWLNLPIGAPFELLATDLYGPLPLTRVGSTEIVRFIHHHTRWVELVPLPSPSANAVAEAFCNHWETVLPISRVWSEPVLAPSGAHWLHALWRCRLSVLRAHQRIAEQNRRAACADLRGLAPGMHGSLRLTPKERQDVGSLFLTLTVRSPFYVLFFRSFLPRSVKPMRVFPSCLSVYHAAPHRAPAPRTDVACVPVTHLSVFVSIMSPASGRLWARRAAQRRPSTPSQPASPARPAQPAQPARPPPIPKQAPLPRPKARAIQGVLPGQFQMADLKRVTAVKAVLGAATTHAILLHKDFVYLRRPLYRALRGDMRRVLIL